MWIVVLGYFPLASALLLTKPTSEWLTRKELESINSIDCLKRRHLGQRSGCGEEPSKIPVTEKGSWGINDFPHFTDSICGQAYNATAEADTAHNLAGQAQPFCDPDVLLSDDAKERIEKALFDAWTTTNVNCSIPGTDYFNEEHFRIAVAVVKALPTSEQDDKSLQLFGDSILGLWGLEGLGVAARLQGRATMCPTSALLVFVQDPFQKMIVSTGSCDFLCMERGGEYIETAARVAWEGGLEKAILASIEETKRVVGTQESLTKTYGTSFTYQGRGAKFDAWFQKEDTYANAQRVILLMVGIVVAVVMYSIIKYAFTHIVRRWWWDFSKDFNPSFIPNSGLPENPRVKLQF